MSSSQDLLDRASVLITPRITRRELVRCDKLVTTPYPNQAEYVVTDGLIGGCNL
jgi:hypothetical protein